MNLIESMSAWLAYKRYVAQHATTAEGQIREPRLAGAVHCGCTAG